MNVEREIVPQSLGQQPAGNAQPARRPLHAFVQWIIGYLRDTAAMARDLAHVPGIKIAALLILPYAGVLIGLDVAGHYGALTNAPLPVQFNLASDGGFGEWLEYSLTLSIAVILFILWRNDRQWAYLTNAALFVWLTLDNSLEIHERAGFWIARPFAGQTALPVEAHHLGEALLFLAIGFIWLSGLWLSLKRTKPRMVIYSLLLAGCIAVAAFFGVIVDLMVVWGPHSPVALEVETFIEDGGEFAMIILTFIVTVAIFDTERPRSQAEMSD